MRCEVKICGLVSRADAEAAVQAGADALGFVFSPSQRRVSPHVVRSIVQLMPRDVACIGVFVDAELSAVNEVASYCGLHAVQLQGKESPEYCDQIELPVIKGFKVGTGIDLSTIHSYRVHAYLFDTDVPGRDGGTGCCFRWDLVDGDSLERPTIVAGGLRVTNVQDACRTAHAHAVDVSSGVERSPGEKDAGLMRAFVQRVVSCECNVATAFEPFAQAVRLRTCDESAATNEEWRLG